MRSSFPALLATLAASGCFSSEEIVYDVEHFLQPCVVEDFRLCILVKTDKERDFSVFTDEIVGFEHTWGQTARIRVLRTETLTAGANAAITYSLERELETTPVDPGTSFTYRFRLQDQTNEVKAYTLDGAGGGELLDGTPFVCEPATVCDTLQTYIGAYGSVSLGLRYPDPITDPFIAWNVSLDASQR